MRSKGRFLMIGNWKMNVTSSDAGQLVDGIVDGTNVKNVDVVLCPPFTSIAATVSSLRNAQGISVGAQNFFPEANGAFTGEISAAMLRETGVSHVIIGHSERREYFHESDEFINKKVKFALSSALIPILCVGETVDQRKAGQAFDVIERQVSSELEDVNLSAPSKLVIAYEPVWAIGTGETATPEIAQEMHAHIRGLLSKKFGEKSARSIKILYGGSMKPENTHSLLSQEDIDGGLIGGASLKASTFCEMIKTADELAE